MHEEYTNALPLHGVSVDEERSSLENSEPSQCSYELLAVEGK